MDIPPARQIPSLVHAGVPAPLAEILPEMFAAGVSFAARCRFERGRGIANDIPQQEDGRTGDP